MKKWIPNGKFIKFIGLIASLSLLLYTGSLFLVLREINKIENLNKEINTKALKEAESQSIKSIIEQNKDAVQNLREFYIQKGDEIKFIKQIEDGARKAGIDFEINSIDVKANQAANFKEDVSVKITLAGSWNTIIKFIDTVEKMPFGASVQNVMVNAEDREWGGSVEFIIFREK